MNVFLQAYIQDTQFAFEGATFGVSLSGNFYFLELGMGSVVAFGGSLRLDVCCLQVVSTQSPTGQVTRTKNGIHSSQFIYH